MILGEHEHSSLVGTDLVNRGHSEREVLCTYITGTISNIHSQPTANCSHSLSQQRAIGIWMGLRPLLVVTLASHGEGQCQ